MLSLELVDEVDYNLQVASLRLPKNIDRIVAIRNIVRTLMDNMTDDYRAVDWWTIAAYAQKFMAEDVSPSEIFQHGKPTIWFAIANVINDLHYSYWWGLLFKTAITFAQEGD